MTIQLAQICRHPIKSHGREDLASVLLLAGECLPMDRHWAVAHAAAKLVPGWNRCVNFARGAKAPNLMAITARLDGDAVMLMHPEHPALTFRPDEAADLPRFLDWVRPLNPPDRAQPVQIVKAGRGMTDTEFPSISVLNRATNRALSAEMGTVLSPDRWRGNLWLDGAEAWAEFGWIGKTLRIGDAVLQVEDRITRCKATTVNPETGRSDADTLGALQSGHGHQDFGIYARVMTGGAISVNDKVDVI